MTTELTTYTPQAQNDIDLASLGKILVQSKYFADTADAAQAIVKVLAGRELGIGPIASMTGIYIVKGRVTMGANLIAAQIKRHPKYDYRVTRLDDHGCDLVFFERTPAGAVEIGKSSFTEADAKSAGLTGSDTYRKFPRNMYFSRALTNGARWYTPDVFGGSPVYTPDELADVPATSYIPAPVEQPTPTNVNKVTGEIVDGPPASDKQLGYIKGTAKRWGWTEDDVIAFAAEIGLAGIATIDALTKQQASALIEAMQAEQKKVDSQPVKQAPLSDEYEAIDASISRAVVGVAK